MIYPTKKLKDVAQVDWGNTSLTKRAFVVGGKYLGVSAAGCDGRMAHYEYGPETLVISAIGANCRRVFYPKERFTAIKNTIVVTPKEGLLDSDYLFYALEGNQIRKRGGAQPFISKGDTENYEIPVPPIAAQRKVVEKIEKQFAKIDEAARLRAESEVLTEKLLLAALHEIFSSAESRGWEEKEFGKIFVMNYGKGLDKSRRSESGKYSVYGANGELARSKEYLVEGEGIIIGRKGSAGEVIRVSGKYWPTDVTYFVTEDNAYDINFAFYLFKFMDLKKYATGIKPGINRNEIYKIKIPIPPLTEQKKIVKKLDALSEKVRAIRDLQSFQSENLKSLKQSILHEAFKQGE
jgi:type I restriction enzyme, S subunit